MTVAFCQACSVLLLKGECERCACAVKAAELVDRMLAADARAHAQWGSVSMRLRVGDIRGAARALDRVALMTDEARRLADVAAIAVVALITIEERRQRSRSQT